MSSLARLFTAGAVSALSATMLVVAPATADTSTVPVPLATTPASFMPETRKKAKKKGLQIMIKGVSAGARASVKVKGPKQGRNGKPYRKVIRGSKTLTNLRSGKYKIRADTVTVPGGTDVATKTAKKVRVRKNKLRRVEVLYTFVATPAPTPVPTPVPSVRCDTGDGAKDTCKIGDTGPGGGTVFYVDNTAANGSRYMEAALSGWNAAAPAADPGLFWGVGTTAGNCGNLDIKTGYGIGTGEANTTSITTTGACAIPAEAPAAWAAMNYAGGSQTDWFLPSRDELNQLYTQQVTVGGFTAFGYWSSSQGDDEGPGVAASKARLQNFNGGAQINGSKSTDRLFVRPVRAFGS